MIALQKPRIAVAFGQGANLAQVSGIWYAMDQVFQLPFSATTSNNPVGSKGDFSVLVAPAGSGIVSSGRVREWVNQGGVLVILGDAGLFTGFTTLSTSSGETRDLPGAIFRASLDLRSPICQGFGGRTEIAVPLDGAVFRKAKKEGGSVVKLSPDEKVKKLLTGWSWGEETEKALRDVVFVHDEPVGQGHVIYFANDPTERAMYPGLHKLLLNSMILMPGN